MVNDDDRMPCRVVVRSPHLVTPHSFRRRSDAMQTRVYPRNPSSHHPTTTIGSHAKSVVIHTLPSLQRSHPYRIPCKKRGYPYPQPIHPFNESNAMQKSVVLHPPPQTGLKVRFSPSYNSHNNTYKNNTLTPPPPTHITQMTIYLTPNRILNDVAMTKKKLTCFFKERNTGGKNQNTVEIEMKGEEG
ncbi:hypothetical protein BC829DRAFT_115899 [Chytridium lagenaria]|nr:hypothetical protein BC829DRAFT_115899 [Chytridium lagenaria]